MEIVKGRVNGIELQFFKAPQTVDMIKEIFSDSYRIFDRKISIPDNSLIVDIGASEGVFSIMMARLFPTCDILAIEPVQRTFFMMLRNIGLNGVMNIDVLNLGVGKESNPSFEMAVGKGDWSGGSSGKMTFNPNNHEKMNVRIETMDNILLPYLKKHDRIRIMKIDIEGMEYDALYNCTLLDRIDHFVGEFHINNRLTAEGRDINELMTWVGSKTNVSYIERCRMAE